MLANGFCRKLCSRPIQGRCCRICYSYETTRESPFHSASEQDRFKVIFANRPTLCRQYHYSHRFRSVNKITPISQECRQLRTISSSTPLPRSVSYLESLRGLTYAVTHSKLSYSLPRSHDVQCRFFTFSRVTWSSDNSKDSKSSNDDLDVDKIQKLDRDLLKNDPELKALLSDIKKDFEGKVKGSKVPTGKETPKPGDGTQIFSTSDIDLTKNGQLMDKVDADFEYDYRVADDIEEYDYMDESELAKQQIRPEKVLPISVERGVNGVFELDELLTLLEDLGAENIVSVPVPAEANFCDHMVVVSAKSKRHLQALNEELLWVHKRKKSKTDPHLVIEGRDKSDWCAMDMGNIVLHIFYGDTREYYDIESLWTLGRDNDPKCQDAGHDPYALSAEDLFWLETGQAANIKTDKTMADDGNTPKSDTNGDERGGETSRTSAEHDIIKTSKTWPGGMKEEDAGWGSQKPSPVD